MPVATRKQIRDSVLTTTNQLDAQIGDLVEDLINITLQEIGSPGWAFQSENHHLWSWLKRKTSFSTVASQEDYLMERDVDKIALMRQTATPQKIIYIPDEIFYRELPNPTETGNPRFYREWGLNGLATKISTAGTIDIVSSSSSDTSSIEVIVTGYVSGRLTTEKYTLNGTSKVSGTTTFDAREICISPSATRVGVLTITTGSTTLLTIGPTEVSPRFKVISLWPIPSGAITVYVEYYKKIKTLDEDSEMPEFDPKFHHIVRIGTLAKVYEHLGKTDDAQRTNAWYSKMVRGMVADDEIQPDLIEQMTRHDPETRRSGIRLHLSEDVIV